MKEERVTLGSQVKLSSDGQFYVILISEGNGNGYEFSAEVLREAVSLFDGVECFVDHALWGHSVRDLCGVFSEAKWDEAENGIASALRPTGPSADIVVELAKEMLSDEEYKPRVGFSADFLITVDVENQVTKVLKVYSTDLVFDPARGGKFVNALNAVRLGADEPEEVSMSEIEKEKKEEQVLAGLNERLAAEAAAIERDKAAVETFLDVDAQRRAVAEEAEKMRKVRQAMCEHLLDVALSTSGLPEAASESIREQYSGRVFEAASLDNSIASARKLVAELQDGSVVAGVPAGQLRMYNTEDKLQAAVDDMLRAPRDKDMQGVDVARLSGIKELYLMLTGDRNLYGGFYPSRAQLATTANFAGLVKNALNKIVVKQWNLLGEAGYNWWENIVVVEHFGSLNDITGTIVGTVGALPELGEREEYTELSIGDSSEVASFQKYGAYIPLTLELIDRDDGRILTQYSHELARAGLRNISKQIAAIFTANAGVGPTMSDTGALFNATAVTTAGGHANLLTTALSSTAWDAAATAVYNQPMLIDGGDNLGLGSKMAVEPRFCLVPRALQKTAHDVFLNAWDVTSNKHSENLLKGAVVPLTVPEFTDANNWAAVCDPTIAPSLYVGERFGIMPEIFVAGHEDAPAVFMNDEHRIKVRHFLAVWVNDYRPLHKSNVA